MQQYLEIGRIVAPHGVTGEMKLELWCDSVAFLGRLKRVYRSGQGEGEMQVTGLRPHKNMGLLRLEGVSDMDAARALVGRVLWAARGDLHLPKGACFIQDLLGCQVLDADTGRCYGTVSDISHPPLRTSTPSRRRTAPSIAFPAWRNFWWKSARRRAISGCGRSPACSALPRTEMKPNDAH